MSMNRTPGVYVREVATLPPSVAEVTTAVPVFIGHTAVGKKTARVATLLEFRQIFGEPPAMEMEVTTQVVASPVWPAGQPQPGKETVKDIKVKALSQNVVPKFLLCYAVEHYFLNGGADAYICSIDNYDQPQSRDRFKTALDEVAEIDEPTLVVPVDAVALYSSSDSTDYYEVVKTALTKCAEKKNRFAIFDLAHPDAASSAQVVAERFRNGIGTEKLSYGAAYHPYLQTSLNYRTDDARINVFRNGMKGLQARLTQDGKTSLLVGVTGEVKTASVSIQIAAQPVEGAPAADFKIETPGKALKLIIELKQASTKPSSILEAWQQYAASKPTHGFYLVEGPDKVGGVGATSQDVALTETTPVAVSLDALRTTDTEIYNAIKEEISKKRVVLPPSAAIAGVYARVDRDRGVWKAPANVSLAGVSRPMLKVTEAEQDRLNVDPTSGKSINAIREFAGKGTLVWGARTLAGNDNEWRYISVRRLFIMIEESARRASDFAVFEPNDAMTWLKVKSMLESYLYGLWERGALAGPTPEQAYFVDVGLNKTMTSQDILEGRMIVCIGVAAVRPAEFVLLTFTHKLQEA